MSKVTNSFNKAWQQVLEYSKKNPWKKRYQTHLDNYISLFCEELEVSQEEFYAKVNTFEDDLMGKIFGLTLETFIEREYDNPDDNIALEYLKKRRMKLSRESALCLFEMKNRSFSIYEIMDSKPGQYLVIKDALLDTKEIKVFEESGSRNAKPLTYVVSKVIQIDGQNYFAGTVFVLPHKFVKEFKKRINKELKSKKLSYKKYDIIPKEICPEVNEILRKYTPDLFADSIFYMMTPPIILNPNGEQIKISSINFIVKDTKAVEAKLDEISVFVRDDEERRFWAYRVPRKKPKPSKLLSSDLFKPTEDIFAGDIELKGNKLLCNSMTEAASEQMIYIIKAHLGDNISMPVIEHEDIYSQSNKQSKQTQEEDSTNSLSDKEQAYLLTEYYNEHIKSTLDIKIPILNNKTPRQCAKKDPKRVINWIKMMEESAKRQIPGGEYDISWAWEELGIQPN